MKSFKKSITKVKYASSKLKSEIKKNISIAIIAAFGFIIALVWRDAIKAVVDEMIIRSGIKGTGHIYQIITAVLITIVCVIGIIAFSRWEREKI